MSPALGVALVSLVILCSETAYRYGRWWWVSRGEEVHLIRDLLLGTAIAASVFTVFAVSALTGLVKYFPLVRIVLDYTMIGAVIVWLVTFWRASHTSVSKIVWWLFLRAAIISGIAIWVLFIM